MSIPGNIGNISTETNMFKWFRTDPTKKLRKQYHAKLERALLAQRNGNIREYSMLTAEADLLRKDLEKLTSDSTDS